MGGRAWGRQRTVERTAVGRRADHEIRVSRPARLASHCCLWGWRWDARVVKTGFRDLNRTLRRAAGFPTSMNLYLRRRSFFLNLHLLFIIRDWFNPCRCGIDGSTCEKITERAGDCATQETMWSIMTTLIPIPIPVFGMLKTKTNICNRLRHCRRLPNRPRHSAPESSSALVKRM